MMEKIDMVLGGCGVYDDSKIHEAVITLLVIACSGAQTVCFAPDRPQYDAINRLTGEPLTEQRDVLVETARITRGDILPLTQARVETLDTLIVPGGFDTAKNLSNFTAENSECQVDHGLQVLVLVIHQTDKPLGFMCIAPVLPPKIFTFPLHITIRTDLGAAGVVEEMGAEHAPCPVDDVVVNEENRVVITPAYVLAENIAQAATGVEELVTHVLVLSA